jgi:hypothetical protein
MSEFSPGWYPDPNDSLKQRYWNGSAWTTQTRENSNGAQDWSSRLGRHDAIEQLHSESHQSEAAIHNSSNRIWAGVAIAVIALFAFSSCAANNSWRMGIDGNGYTVYCEDGTISKSGGIQGACSHHGGVR